MKRPLLILIAAIAPVFLFAQTTFTARPIPNNAAASLYKTFKSYQLFALDVKTLNAFVKDRQPGPINFELSMPGYARLKFAIHAEDILSPNYTLTVADLTGKQVYGKPACMTYAGNLEGVSGSKVRLTITENMFYGLIHGDKDYFIEPLRYFDRNGAADIFVIYETKDVQPIPGLTCGVTERNEKMNGNNFIAGPAGIGTCKLTELAIATDRGMVDRFGNATLVSEHNIAVANTMLNIYSDDLFGANYLEFKVKTQYIPLTSLLDPVGGDVSTDASTLLGEFQTWGQAGNFGTTYDIGVMWTSRDLTFSGSSSVIGLAYVGTVCTTNRYQILEDMNGATGIMEGALEGHETGHNFNAMHDAAGDPYIMAPALSSTPNTNFSPASTTAITNYINTAACLSLCTAQAPTAEFNRSSNSICTGNSVTVIDESSGDIISRTWSFPGGSPTSSTTQSQAVSYATSGTKTITLTVTNAFGSNSISKDVYVSPAFTTANCRTTTAPGNAETPLLVAFNLGTINHTESLILGGSYTNYSCTENTVLQPSTTYTGTMNFGFTGPDIFCIAEVYIDYNNDGDFSDAGELITRSGCTRSRYEFSFTTPVPTVTNQLLRMREIAIACPNVSTNGCSMPSNAQARDFGVYFAAAVVPVNLLSFEGEHVGDKNLLHWRTASEINNHHFNVERSLDGNNFIPIGEVAAAGNNGTAHDYYFTDDLDNVKAYDRFYYRLKMVDLNGQYRFSNVIQLTKNSNSGFVIYPNPVKRGSNLEMYLDNSSQAALNIFNSTGQLLLSRSSIKGNNISITIPTSWPAGLYMVRVFDGKKFISRTIRVE